MAEKVLVVDQASSCESILSKLRQEDGFDAEAVETSADAAQRASEINPDLLVVSWKLGDDTFGIDIINQLRYEVGVDVPSILVSDEPLSELENSLKHTANTRLVHKPFDVQMLLKTYQEIRGYTG